VNVLTTIISKPVNGRAAAAVTQLKELAQAATDSGASRVNTSRVISGPNIGQLQLRIFASDLAEAGKISAAMWASGTAARSMDDANPPGELVGLIRSNVIYRAAPTIADDPAMATVLAIQPNPGKISQLETRFSEWADLWVEGGAMQSFITSSVTGTAGPTLFMTSTYGDWESWNNAMTHARGSELMRTLRESSDSAGTIIANMQLANI